MNDAQDVYCLLENDQLLKDIREDINTLNKTWNNDINKLRDQLNKLDKSIDEIDKKYNTIKPEINKHSSNINTLLNRIFEQHKKSITYSNIFKMATIPLILLVLKKLL